MIFHWCFGDALSTWLLFVELLASGVVVVLAGSRLTRLVDRFADERRLGHAFVGMLLLATVTSLPEVVTCCSAVAIGAVDLAFATLLGSCSFNITLIVIFNAVIGGGSILSGAKPAHSMTSSLGIFMIGLTLVGISLTEKFGGSPRLAQACEIGTVAMIALTYVGGIKLTHRMEQPLVAESEPASLPARTPGLTRKIVGLSIVLVAAAWWLAQTGDVLSTHPIQSIGRPLGGTFVGACFLAIASSLPEIVTGVAAVRLRNLDLALGNIFGSNMFNIFIITMAKVTSWIRGDALLMAGDNFHPGPNLIAGLLPILLTAVAVGGLAYRSSRRIFGLGPDSVLIGLFYIGGMILLLAHS